jgi:hypothetical protein
MAIILVFVALRFTAAQAIVSQCGRTPEEARAKGCLFEMTGSSWVPKECYDPETEAEFLNFKDWQYHRDINYTQGTADREENLQSCLYRMIPVAAHEPFDSFDEPNR